MMNNDTALILMLADLQRTIEALKQENDALRQELQAGADKK